MKKLKWSTSKTLIGQIAAPTCLLAGTAGIVFGISAGTYKLMYTDLDDAANRLKAAINNNYYVNDSINQWNMYQKGTSGEKGFVAGVEQPYEETITDAWWNKVHHQGGKKWSEEYLGVDPSKMGLKKQEDKESEPLTESEVAERKKYAALLLDGATHVAMDRSFNQSIYNGLINFIANKHHKVTNDQEAVTYKPSQDVTQEFVNIYHAATKVFRNLVLSGFNHITPMLASGEQDTDGTFKFDDPGMANAGYILIDGELANNQNLASVLFRADQPAFLTAIAAAMYFYNNLHLYHDRYQNISVATFGGTPIPTVVGYMGGFQRGVEFFNEFVLKEAMLQNDAVVYMNKKEATRPYKSDYFTTKLLPASKYKDEIETIREDTGSKSEKIHDMIQKLYEEFSIKFIKLGEFGTHFTGSFVPGEGLGIVKQYLNRDASAIIAVAGSQTLDAVQEIMNQNSKCIVIGVDTASENSDFQKPQLTSGLEDKTVAPDGSKPKQSKNIIKYSAIKDMCEATDKILRLGVQGKNWDRINDKPWTTHTPIPSYSEKEILPTSYLDWEVVPGTENFRIIGLKNDIPKDYHVLYLPTEMKNGNDTYYLSDIMPYSFDADQLKQFDILKLGKMVNNWTVNFHSKAFICGHTSGFKYVDFSEHPNIDFKGDEIVFSGMGAYEDSPVYHKGVVKLADNSWQDSSRFFDPQWFIVEPHPTKSVCGFGFKTCANIENGLVSISWDGWYYLLEALRHLTVFNPRIRSIVSFMEAFATEAVNYCEEHYLEFELPEEFQRKVQSGDYKELATFDYDSIICKYYSHVNLILSQVLNNYVLTFPNSMTIARDDQGKFIIPKSSIDMSIIEWLRLNMYFTV